MAAMTSALPDYDDLPLRSGLRCAWNVWQPEGGDRFGCLNLLTAERAAEAQLALELAWAARGPLRGGVDLEIALQPFADAARTSHRAAEALISAHAHAAGVRRRRRG